MGIIDYVLAIARQQKRDTLKVVNRSDSYSQVPPYMRENYGRSLICQSWLPTARWIIIKVMIYKIKVNKGHQLIALSNTILREIASHIT